MVREERRWTHVVAPHPRLGIESALRDVVDEGFLECRPITPEPKRSAL